MYVLGVNTNMHMCTHTQHKQGCKIKENSIASYLKLLSKHPGCKKEQPRTLKGLDKIKMGGQACVVIFCGLNCDY